MDGEDRKTPPEHYADRHRVEGDWYHGIAKELEKEDGRERGRDHEGKPEQGTGKEQSEGPDKETRRSPRAESGEDEPLENKPLDLDPIKSRLIDAGYPHPGSHQPASKIRDVSREAQKARADLRDHVIDDVWALLDEVEALRERGKP